MDARARRALPWAAAAVALVALLSILGCCGCGGVGPAATLAPAPAPPDVPVPRAVREPAKVPTDVQMRNVLFQLEEDVQLMVRWLRGELVSTEETGVVVIGDQNGFFIRIFFAEIGVSPDVLQTLLNRYTFGELSDLIRVTDVDVLERALRIQAVVEKAGVGLPVEIVANISATPQGWLRASPTAIRVCDIPVTSLLRELDIQLDELVGLEAAGVRLDGNDLLLDPAKLLPPPPIEGFVERVAVTDSALVLYYRPGPGVAVADIEPIVPLDTTAANYMYLRHGTIRIRKVYIAETEAQLIDQDPSDPLHFYHDYYYNQLVAGYSRLTSGLGVLYYVVDFPEVGRTVEPAEAEIDPRRPDTTRRPPSGGGGRPP